MYKVKMNKTILSAHFYYNIWYYILGVIIAAFIWACCYYYIDPPADKKIDIYYIKTRAGNFKSVYYNKLKGEFPDIPRIRMFDIGLSYYIGVIPEPIYTDDVDKQIDKAMKKNKGDIYIFPYEVFSKWAKKGLLMSLDDYTERLKSNEDLSSSEFSELLISHPYEGRDAIYGIKAMNEERENGEYFWTNEEYIISIGINTGNKDNALDVMKWLIFNLDRVYKDEVSKQYKNNEFTLLEACDKIYSIGNYN